MITKEEGLLTFEQMRGCGQRQWKWEESNYQITRSQIPQLSKSMRMQKHSRRYRRITQKEKGTIIKLSDSTIAQVDAWKKMKSIPAEYADHRRIREKKSKNAQVD